jgi:murein DD-endopeptidase MepM/ murein hydrolase activator NlpD
VPDAPNLRQVTYKVRRGDTLNSVSRRFGVQPDEIMAWNQLRSPTLFAGQRLTLTVARGPAKLTNPRPSAGSAAASRPGASRATSARPGQKSTTGTAAVKPTSTRQARTVSGQPVAVKAATSGGGPAPARSSGRSQASVRP